MQLSLSRNAVAWFGVLAFAAAVACGGDDGASYKSPPPDACVGDCQAPRGVDKLMGDSVGRMCSADAECGGGFCATDDMVFRSYPGGYCSGLCMQDSDCGDAGTCAPGLPGGLGTCYRKCTADIDCGREGYRCRRNVTGSGLQCQPGVQPLPDGTTGKACTRDDDCGGAAMSCASQSSGTNPLPFPGGYCTQACVDNSDCGAGGICSPNFAVIAMGTCYKTCSASSECRDGYACRVLSEAAIGLKDSGMNRAQALVCVPAPATPSDQDAGR